MLSGLNNQSNNANNCGILGESNVLSNVNHSLISGKGNIITNSNKGFVSGNDNKLLESNNSNILGESNEISGSSHSIAIGNENKITDTDYSVALGYKAEVEGDTIFSIGSKHVNGNVVTMSKYGDIEINKNIRSFGDVNKEIFTNVKSKTIKIGGHGATVTFNETGKIENSSFFGDGQLTTEDYIYIYDNHGVLRAKIPIDKIEDKQILIQDN